MERESEVTRTQLVSGFLSAKGNARKRQSVSTFQKPYVFLSKNNTISTSICFLFSRKKWSEKKSANSGDETVEKLIILDFPAFFAIFFQRHWEFLSFKRYFPFSDQQFMGLPVPLSQDV